MLQLDRDELKAIEARIRDLCKEIAAERCSLQEFQICSDLSEPARYAASSCACMRVDTMVLCACAFARACVCV